MILTWEEELIWQYNFQKKKAKPEGKATPRKVDQESPLRQALEVPPG